MFGDLSQCCGSCLERTLNEAQPHPPNTLVWTCRVYSSPSIGALLLQMLLSHLGRVERAQNVKTRPCLRRHLVLYFSPALEHGRCYGLGRDALIIECIRTRTEVSLGHGCSHHRVHSNTNTIMACGCSGNRMLFEHERYRVLGMDALKIERTRTQTLSWFGH